MLGEAACKYLREQIELISEAGTRFDQSRFLAGELSPVFFGSALNNFGVEPFLDALLDLAPAPGALDNEPIDPNDETFTGLVFKIQANMDPRHRDRMVFLRVLSGRFERDMAVYHPRLEREVRLAHTYRIFARARTLLEEAFPGDIIGIINPGTFVIGDTVSTGEPLEPIEIPRFSPERFAVLRNENISRHKQFNKGLTQLEEEGAIQVSLRNAASGASLSWQPWESFSSTWSWLACGKSMEFRRGLIGFPSHAPAGSTSERGNKRDDPAQRSADMPRQGWPAGGVVLFRPGGRILRERKPRNCPEGGGLTMDREALREKFRGALLEKDSFNRQTIGQETFRGARRRGRRNRHVRIS